MKKGYGKGGKKSGPLDAQWSFVELDDTSGKKKNGTVNIRASQQTAGRDVENDYDPFKDPKKRNNTVNTPATAAPRSKGKSMLLTPGEEGKEEEEYEEYLKDRK